TAPLFEKMQDGTLGVADFFAQHNEHRIFFPRLIFFALGRLTHWNIRTELWVVWLLALVCLFSIRQMAGPSRTGGFARVSPTGRERETTGSRAVAEQRPEVRADLQHSPKTFWLMFAASVLLFSPL